MATQAAAGVGNEAPSGIDDTFRVLDANGTDGNASFMLPNPEGGAKYQVYARALLGLHQQRSQAPAAQVLQGRRVVEASGVERKALPAGGPFGVRPGRWTRVPQTAD